MPNQVYKNIRLNSFLQNIPLNENLIKLVKDTPSHKFLINPASQHLYLIYINYIKNFAKKWFDKNVNQLEFLDWGCGKGHVTFLLNEIGINNVTSCDRVINHDDSAFYQATPIIDKNKILVVLLKDDYRLPFEDEKFDIVMSFGVLEHVPNDMKSLKEINRILKPNGLLFTFFLPYRFSYTQRLAHLMGDYYHDRLYTKKQIAEMLIISNFLMLDIFHGQLLPKNSINYFKYKIWDRIDWYLVENTFLKYFATNICFVASKIKK